MQRAKVIRSLGMHIARSSHGTPLSLSVFLPRGAVNRLKRVPKNSARVIALFLSCVLSLSFSLSIAVIVIVIVIIVLVVIFVIIIVR